VNFATLATLQK